MVKNTSLSFFWGVSGPIFQGPQKKSSRKFQASAASCTVSKASKLRASDLGENGGANGGTGAPYHTHGYGIWVFPKIGGFSPKMDGEKCEMEKPIF